MYGEDELEGDGDGHSKNDANDGVEDSVEVEVKDG